MTQLQKSLLGPTQTRACAACGKAVSVHWASLLSFAPLLIGVAMAEELSYRPGWAAFAVAGGACAMFALHGLLMPLVPRDA